MEDNKNLGGRPNKNTITLNVGLEQKEAAQFFSFLEEKQIDKKRFMKAILEHYFTRINPVAENIIAELENNARTTQNEALLIKLAELRSKLNERSW